MKTILPVLMAVLLLSCSRQSVEFAPENLKSEYLVNPIGIDTKNPRFTWQLLAEESGIQQRAYQVIVGTDSSNVAAGNGDAWNSGSIQSETIPVKYEGAGLQPFTKYFWQVKVQLQNGSWTANTKVASFETGMMDPTNWKGDWISDSYDFNIKPAPYFRKGFTVGKKIKSARAYIAAAGLYELYLNGEKVGNHRLDPMYTRFDRRVLYVTYDVTKKSFGRRKTRWALFWGMAGTTISQRRFGISTKHPGGARPKFCMDLRIQYEDGTEETLSTDQGWKTSLSPVIFQ